MMMHREEKKSKGFLRSALPAYDQASLLLLLLLLLLLQQGVQVVGEIGRRQRERDREG